MERLICYPSKLCENKNESVMRNVILKYELRTQKLSYSNTLARFRGEKKVLVLFELNNLQFNVNDSSICIMRETVNGKNERDPRRLRFQRARVSAVRLLARGANIT